MLHRQGSRNHAFKTCPYLYSESAYVQRPLSFHFFSFPCVQLSGTHWPYDSIFNYTSKITKTVRMAHKHNRRRTRPRHRNHSCLNPTCDISDHLSASTDSSTLSESPDTGTAPKQRLLPPMMRNTQEAVKIENEQSRLFGGESGEDIGLCFKMLEAFKGMSWIDGLD